MGLRESARLVLTPQEIQHCWGEGAGSQGWEKIRTYLIYDLEDTKLIADKLVPSYYYESLIVPGMNLQQLSLTGNGTKWLRVLERQYPGYKPTADPKLKFEGGLVSQFQFFLARTFVCKAFAPPKKQICQVLWQKNLTTEENSKTIE